jgi:hypothetical protein
MYFLVAHKNNWLVFSCNNAQAFAQFQKEKIDQFVQDMKKDPLCIGG